MNFISAFPLFIFLLLTHNLSGQEFIPIDTTHFLIEGESYIIEKYHGKDAIYLKNASVTLRDTKFKNGAIEFDVFLTERQSFPGVFFRQSDDYNCETFFLRPHLSGKVDANQGSPIVNGIQAFQLYFGEAYSSAYKYNYSDWTHVKVVVNGMRAQAYLDYSEKAILSWNLVHEEEEGKISFGTSFAPIHFANFTINKDDYEIVDFAVKGVRKSDEKIVKSWQISNKIEEESLNNLSQLKDLIGNAEFKTSLDIVKNIAVDISHLHNKYDQEVKGNTVFAKLNISSKKEVSKLFHFGYSDRVMVILNGKPIYKGTNKWRSRDYRYLGTIGFFDSVYLNLETGENELVLAVSEDFGGWLVTGKFEDYSNIKIN